MSGTHRPTITSSALHGHPYRQWLHPKGWLHRVGGPAVEMHTGSKMWYVMGKYMGYQLGIRVSSKNFISSDRHGLPSNLPPGYGECP